MIELRHFLHPVRSAKGLYRRIESMAEHGLTERKISALRRNHRNSCWCGGDLTDFSLRPVYGICKECGCYVNRKPPFPDELDKLYSFGFYWHALQKHRGHPIIEERTSNDRADGRVEFWISLVESLQVPGKRVLEVGCAHGVLLKELSVRGFECVGVEVDKETARWTRQKTGLPILSGIFPDVDAPECDLFLSFDVLEHSISPERFLRAASQLLAVGGIAIIQTPIELKELTPPFGEMYEKTFDDAQHLFVFSKKGIRLLAERAGLHLLSEPDWRIGHEIVILKKPAS